MLSRRDFLRLSGTGIMILSGCNKVSNLLTPTVETFATPTIFPATYPPLSVKLPIAIHTGSYSIDRNDLSQGQINAAVNAIVTNIPNTRHIVIGTYLDYPGQFSLWSDAVHNADRHLYVRSAGFNSWQGTFGEVANGDPDEHRRRMADWVDSNHRFFEEGDTFEAVPDEAANGQYWYDQFPTSGVGTSDLSKRMFNEFITSSVSEARNRFDANDQPGVRVDVYHDSPSVIKDIITPDTAQNLSALGTDNYPERDTTNPKEMGVLMQHEIMNWVEDVHPRTAREITFGPSVYEELDPEVQRQAFSEEATVITELLPNLALLTIWQLGEEGNDPKSRIFDYQGGEWRPRPVVEAINELAA